MEDDIGEGIVVPAQQGGNKFYAIQEADSATEKDLERLLLQTTAAIYVERDISRIRLAVIGALENARNFLYKYVDELPRDAEILDTIADGIKMIRTLNQDTEAINRIFQDARFEIMKTLGIVLGFRKAKREREPWDMEMIKRQQLPSTPKLQKIISKKKIRLQSSVR